jgi:hypothetical protein
MRGRDNMDLVSSFAPGTNMETTACGSAVLSFAYRVSVSY